MSRYAGGLSKPDAPAYGRYPVAGGGGPRDAGHDLFPSDDPLPPSGGGSAGVPSAGFISGGADNRQAMLERQRQLAAQRNRDRMTGGITMTDAPANSTTAMPLSGRSTTVSRGAPVFSAPRGGDTVFDDNPRQSRSGGGGAGGWTDSSVPRDLGGHARGGGGGGGDRSSRGSEHSDKESGGGSALAEALALRERDRKRTMEERAAVDHERQARMAANVSAVYDPPAATPVPAHTAPPQGPGHAGVSPPTRPALGSGRSYDADPPPSAPPAADPYPSSSATIHAPPAALPASAPRSDPHLALDPPLQATAHTGSGDPLAPSAYYTSQPGGGGASSSGAQAAKHSGPATTGGGGGDEGEGSLMAVAPLMVPPSATPSYPVPAGLAPLDLSDMRRFLTTPTPRAAGIVQCYIVRDRSGITNRMYPVYSAYLKDGDRFMMASRKRSQNKTSNYLVSLDKRDLNRDGPSFIGKVRSNFVGTEFVAFDDGIAPDVKPVPADAPLRQEIAVVNYASNVLGSRGPRKMKVAVPKVTADGRRVVFQPESEEDGMMARFKAGYIQDMVLLVNKPPKWNESVGAYVLNFNGRVTMASVKNFQLVSPEDHEAVLLQFGRTGKDMFTMDYQWPLSPLQAYAICMSSFDYKLACE